MTVWFAELDANAIEDSEMKRLLIHSVVIVGLLFSAAAATASDFPTQEPMGGKPFGHSVKALGNGLYVFRW